MQNIDHSLILHTALETLYAISGLLIFAFTYTILKFENRMIEFVYLAVFGLSVFSLELLHAIVPLFFVERSVIFIPASWGLARIIETACIFLAYSTPASIKPKHITRVSFIGFLVLPLLAIRNDYYLQEPLFSIIGRPLEIFALILSLWFAVYILLDKKKSGRLYFYVVSSLLYIATAQLIMLFSVNIYDAAFWIAHVFKYFSMVPMFLLMKNLIDRLKVAFNGAT